MACDHDVLQRSGYCIDCDKKSEIGRAIQRRNYRKAQEVETDDEKKDRGADLWDRLWEGD